MRELMTFLDQPVFARFSLALLHFVWQGAALALFALLLLLSLRRAAPTARYLAALLILAAMSICPLVTFLVDPALPGARNTMVQTAASRPAANASQPTAQLPAAEPDSSRLPAAPTAQLPTPSIDFLAHPANFPTIVPPRSVGESLLRAFYDRLEGNLAPILIGWFCCVVVLSTRLLLGWLGAERLWRQGLKPLRGRWPAALKRMSHSLQVSRPVRLLESSLVQVPLVIGWLRPLILLPASALLGLTPAQLEALICHELAHIRRKDYLINLFQVIVETLLFYHPAVWWLSNRVRVEREHCCDDLAAAACGSTLVYARALTQMEHLRRAPPRLALAAGSGSLFDLVRRLLSKSTVRRVNFLCWPTILVAFAPIALLFLLLRLSMPTAYADTFRPAAPYEIVSISSNIAQPSGGSVLPTISADGRFVAFCSWASDLVADDTNGKNDVFLYDLQQDKIERVSVSTRSSRRHARENGHSGWGWSDSSWNYYPEQTAPPALSADGRFIAFASAASNLAPGDTNRAADIFVHDRRRGTTERVSINSAGEPANAASSAPAISDDGRFVLFASAADNLTPGDSNDRTDIFLRDRKLAHTERVIAASAGRTRPRPSLSANGRFLVYLLAAAETERRAARAKSRIVLLDRRRGESETIALLPAEAGPAAVAAPLISADGRTVVFASSDATGPGPPAPQISVYDRPTHRTERINLAQLAAQPDEKADLVSVSRDGRFIVFTLPPTTAPGGARQPLRGLVYDRTTRQTKTLFAISGSKRWSADLLQCSQASVSADGRYVAFDLGIRPRGPDDTRWSRDIFVCDTHAGVTKLISSVASNQLGNLNAETPWLTTDGRFVAFASASPNLVPRDTNGLQDVFVRDRQTGRTERASISIRGAQANGESLAECSISDDGRFVAFSSLASNLVVADLNQKSDVFMRDRLTGETQRVSVSSSSDEARADSPYPPGYPNLCSLHGVISGNGRFVAFVSTASNLVPNDTNHTGDVFVRDLEAGATERVSVSSAGAQGDGFSGDAAPWPGRPLAISADGRFVAFVSEASNLVPGDNNDAADVFVRDRLKQRTELVSVTSGGRQWPGGAYQPALSPDGRFFVFAAISRAAYLSNTWKYDIFVRDRLQGTTEQVSISNMGRQGKASFSRPAISADGRFVAFQAARAANLWGLPLDSNEVMVRDRTAGVTTAVGKNPSGEDLFDGASEPAISGDGRFIALRCADYHRDFGVGLHPGAIVVCEWPARDLVAKQPPAQRYEFVR